MFMGKIEGSFYNSEIVIKGDGTVKGQTRGQILHKWYHEDNYKLTRNHTLENIPPKDGLYSMGEYKVKVKKTYPYIKLPAEKSLPT